MLSLLFPSPSPILETTTIAFVDIIDLVDTTLRHVTLRIPYVVWTPPIATSTDLYIAVHYNMNKYTTLLHHQA